jgi:hypothetical protein
MGRPEMLNAAQTKHIGVLSRRYGGLRAWKILNAPLRHKDSSLRNLDLFPKGTKISKPTLYKYARRAGTEFVLGRRSAA